MYPLLACFSCALLAKPLLDVNDQTLQTDLGDLRPPSNPPSTLFTFNGTSPSVAATVLNDLSIRCDGDKYGFKPDIRDCTSALQHQVVGPRQLKFGQRGSISETDFLPLPYRLMGGML